MDTAGEQHSVELALLVCGSAFAFLSFSFTITGILELCLVLGPVGRCSTWWHHNAVMAVLWLPTIGVAGWLLRNDLHTAVPFVALGAIFMCAHLILLLFYWIRSALRRKAALELPTQQLLTDVHRAMMAPGQADAWPASSTNTTQVQMQVGATTSDYALYIPADKEEAALQQAIQKAQHERMLKQAGATASGNSHSNSHSNNTNTSPRDSVTSLATLAQATTATLKNSGRYLIAGVKEVTGTGPSRSSSTRGITGNGAASGTAGPMSSHGHGNASHGQQQLTTSHSRGVVSVMAPEALVRLGGDRPGRRPYMEASSNSVTSPPGSRKPSSSNMVLADIAVRRSGYLERRKSQEHANKLLVGNRPAASSQLGHHGRNSSLPSHVEADVAEAQSVGAAAGPVLNHVQFQGAQHSAVVDSHVQGSAFVKHQRTGSTHSTVDQQHSRHSTDHGMDLVEASNPLHVHTRRSPLVEFGQAGSHHSVASGSSSVHGAQHGTAQHSRHASHDVVSPAEFGAMTHMTSPAAVLPAVHSTHHQSPALQQQYMPPLPTVQQDDVVTPRGTYGAGAAFDSDHGYRSAPRNHNNNVPLRSPASQHEYLSPSTQLHGVVEASWSNGRAHQSSGTPVVLDASSLQYNNNSSSSTQLNAGNARSSHERSQHSPSPAPGSHHHSSASHATVSAHNSMQAHRAGHNQSASAGGAVESPAVVFRQPSLDASDSPFIRGGGPSGSGMNGGRAAGTQHLVGSPSIGGRKPRGHVRTHSLPLAASTSLTTALLESSQASSAVVKTDQ